MRIVQGAAIEHRHVGGDAGEGIDLAAVFSGKLLGIDRLRKNATERTRSWGRGTMLQESQEPARVEKKAPAAKAAPGVHLVLTGADIADLNPLKSGAMPRQPDGTNSSYQALLPLFFHSRDARGERLVVGPSYYLRDQPRAIFRLLRLDRVFPV